MTDEHLPTDELEQVLAEHFTATQTPPAAALEAAKALLDLRRVDDVLMAWGAELSGAVRSSDPAAPADPNAAVRFVADDTTVVVRIEPGRIIGFVEPATGAVIVEWLAAEPVEVPVDDAGGFTARGSGPARLRMPRSPAGDLVTEPLLVPPR